MAEKIKENQFDAVGVNPFNAPVPGESLTSSPDMPRAWERPPQYTSQDNAMEAIYMEITSEDSLRKLINISDGPLLLATTPLHHRRTILALETQNFEVLIPDNYIKNTFSSNSIIPSTGRQSRKRRKQINNLFSNLFTR